jgi:ribosomal protein S6E (S10)
MAFKINVSEKNGKTWKLEAEAQELIDKKLGDVVKGELVSPDLEGYELEITGASDKSGFTAMKNVEGIVLKRILLGYGKGMKRKPKKEGKKKLSNSTPKGLKLRKTVRGNTISEFLTQINMKVAKEGKKPLAEIYGPKEEAPAEAQ